MQQQPGGEPGVGAQGGLHAHLDGTVPVFQDIQQVCIWSSPLAYERP